MGYRATILDDVATGEIDDKLIVLRGPRRVGKSVVLKDTALALCARPDVDPRQIIYLPADGMRAKDLSRAASLGRMLTRSVERDAYRPRVWLFDEVTGIDGWTSTIKYLRDNTAFGDDTVICTGSSWSDDSNVERDLFAGRSGASAARRARMLLPMRFHDVLRVTQPDIPVPDPLAPWELQSTSAANAVEMLESFTDELDLAWQSYLVSGGFPRAVAEHHRVGTVSEAFLHDLMSWLHTDIDPEASVDSLPLLISELHMRSASPLNKSATSEALGYSTRKAFELRLSRLTRSHAGLWAHQIDGEGRRITGAQSKFYLTDPLLAWLGPLLRAGSPEPDMTVLTEAALAVALAATIDDRQPGRWMSEDTIGYVRTGSGQEVDFGPIPVPSPGGTNWTIPIESKWVSNGWRKEAKVIEGKFGRGILATKNITRLDTPAWAIPAAVLALLIG